MKLYTITLLAAILLACAVAVAAPRANVFTLLTGTNTTATASADVRRGTLLEIHASGPSGELSVTHTPIGGAAAVVATGTVTTAKSWRPLVDYTGTDGEALTSDPPGPVWITGNVEIAVTGAATGQTWTVNIVIDPE
jgi:hypothetical protein